MRILALHSDFIKFEPKKKAIKDAEVVKKAKQIVKECLVVFSSVEKTDEKNPGEVVKKYVKEIKDIAKQVKTKKIVLYPYVHLSTTPSNPKTALIIFKKAEEILKKEYKVTRAPFGWYKSFNISCKGHPLSELSREFSAEGEVEEKIDPKQLLKEISKTRLDREKLRDNDHRILGIKMDLFSFNEVAPGMVFWHDNGLIIRNELINYWREEHKQAGYKEVSTPQIMDSKLWKISGHWGLYKENMFLTEYEKRKFAIKPMNCPGGMLVYKNQPRSYKELPLRLSELGIVHRLELSGVLSGLFRVIQFTQDDAHIFCTERQLESEIINVINLFKKMLDIFGFKYTFTLSVRSDKKKDKYLGDDEIWENSEGALSNALYKLGIKFEKMPGEAKFYGPSLDVIIKDSLDREWQCSTLQLDFSLPERFNLTYIDEKNNEKIPIMLHRVVYGSLERFIGVLLEHTNGNLPLWLAPVQVIVLTINKNNTKTAEKITKKISSYGIRVNSDFADKTLNYKIREAEIKRIPYMIVIGDKEEQSETIAIRKKGLKKVEYGIKLEKFISDIKKEIKQKTK